MTTFRLDSRMSEPQELTFRTGSHMWLELSICAAVIVFWLVYALLSGF